jgi:hypothetical protein
VGDLWKKYKVGHRPGYIMGSRCHCNLCLHSYRSAAGPMYVQLPSTHKFCSDFYWPSDIPRQLPQVINCVGRNITSRMGSLNFVVLVIIESGI